jgi:hypothetical protein
MEKNIPKTALEIELLCDNIILRGHIRKQALHIQALQEVLKTGKVRGKK